MYNTADETDMKVVLKVLHLWSTTIRSKLKAEVGESYTDISTRKMQVTLSKEIENLDTLGVIWPI